MTCRASDSTEHYDNCKCIDIVPQGKARQGKARQSKAKQSKAKQSKAKQRLGGPGRQGIV
jgi:hypothetical protein